MTNGSDNIVTRNKQSLSLIEFAQQLCADSLGAPLGKVEVKFVQSMLKGISVSRSVNLTEIAKGLGESISLHATHKRLSRNLYDLELTRNLANRLLKHGSKCVGSQTRLIVRTSELQKKFARRIEFLPSAEGPSETGFKVCEIIASEPGSKTYLPLLSHVWSDAVPDFASDAMEVYNSIQKVLAATAYKGVVYVDDRSIPSETCKLILADRKINYMIMVDDQDLQVRVRNEEFSIVEMLDRVDTRYGKILYKLVPVGFFGASQTDLDLFIHAGCAAVKMPLSGRSVNFIVLKTKSSILEEQAIPFLTTHTDLRSRKALMGLVDSFLSTQDVIELHRRLRESFNPENFRVLSYNRLQLLMTLLEAVICYEVSAKGDELPIYETFAESPHDGKLERTYLLPNPERAVAK